MSGGVWLVSGAFVGSLIVAAWFWIHRRVAAMDRRARRLLADELEPRSSFPAVVSVPVRHERTVLACDLSDPLLHSFPAGADASLEVTERELVIRHQTRNEAWIPLRRVTQSSFIPSFLGNKAPEGGALLRVVWQRGEETLWTVFRVDSWVDAEKVRQQVHLRAHGWRQ